jgi:hypothetical protein
MTIDTFLGLFGASTGVIGLFAAYYFYKKSVRSKLLGIAYTDPIPLLMAMGNLEVIYEGAVISALSRVYILFWNRGTAPIETGDFLSPVRIGACAPILHLQIHDKDAAASATLNENARELAIRLLRPGEAITLVAEVTSESYTPDIDVQMKSADMSTFTPALQYWYPSIFAFLAFSIALLIEIAVVRAWGFSITGYVDAHLPRPPKEIETVVFALIIAGIFFSGVLFFLIPFALSVLASIAFKKVFRRIINPVAWKFSQFKTSALTIRTRSSAFRRFIDTEYKKIAPS